MTLDAHKNFALGRVVAAPSPPDSGTTVVLVTGDALKMPATPFNAVASATGVRPTGATAEIVRVTNIAADTLTIVRAQEGTGARTILVGDDFSAAITAKTLTDVEAFASTAIFPSAAFTGSLVFGTAASVIIPGGTSLDIRNNANSQSHIKITDKGQMTFYPETAATGFPSTSVGVQFGTTSNTYTTPQATGSSLVRIDGNFRNTVDSTGYWRVLSTEAHWTDTAFGASTFAAAYFNVYHDTASPVDIQDIIGVIGRVFFTSTGKSSVGAWGVRGDLNFSGAADLTSNIAAAVVGHQGTWSAAAIIPAYAALYAASHNLNQGGAVTTDGYGALINVPINAQNNNIGVHIGTRFTFTAARTVGLFVGSNGAWVKGQMGIPTTHETGANTNATMALLGGDTGAHTALVALYFYKDATAYGYVGFDGDSTSVIAGHTKLLTDLVLVGARCVVDVNGQIYSLNRITAENFMAVQTIRTSGSAAGAFTWTGAAHTTLSSSTSFAEHNWNGARVVGFDAAGGTVATAYQYQFQRVTYSAAAAMTITIAATMRITGAPTTNTSLGFAPTLTASYALYLDSGNVGFAGATNFVLDSTTGTKIGTATTQKLGFWNAAPIVQPTFGATIVNNVTSGGTTKQIDDFTGAVYATDAATIRNDIYQLAAAFKIIVDGLRLAGNFS